MIALLYKSQVTLLLVPTPSRAKESQIIFRESEVSCSITVDASLNVNVHPIMLPEKYYV